MIPKIQCFRQRIHAKYESTCNCAQQSPRKHLREAGPCREWRAVADPLTSLRIEPTDVSSGNNSCKELDCYRERLGLPRCLLDSRFTVIRAKRVMAHFAIKSLHNCKLHHHSYLHNSRRFRICKRLAQILEKKLARTQIPPTISGVRSRHVGDFACSGLVSLEKTAGDSVWQAESSLPRTASFAPRPGPLVPKRYARVMNWRTASRVHGSLSTYSGSHRPCTMREKAVRFPRSLPRRSTFRSRSKSFSRLFRSAGIQCCRASSPRLTSRLR